MFFSGTTVVKKIFFERGEIYMQLTIFKSELFISPLSPAPSSGNLSSAFSSVGLPIPDISCERSGTIVSFCVWLLSLSVVVARFLHVCSGVGAPCLFMTG